MLSLGTRLQIVTTAISKALYTPSLRKNLFEEATKLWTLQDYRLCTTKLMNSEALLVLCGTKLFIYSLVATGDYKGGLHNLRIRHMHVEIVAGIFCERSNIRKAHTILLLRVQTNSQNTKKSQRSHYSGWKWLQITSHTHTHYKISWRIMPLNHHKIYRFGGGAAYA